MTERINHTAEARKHIDWAHEQQAEEGKYEHTVRDNALLAQAEANLAIAEQMRVANIIALVAVEDTISVERGAFDALYDGDHPGFGAAEYELRPEIKVVLGL